MCCGLHARMHLFLHHIIVQLTYRAQDDILFATCQIRRTKYTLQMLQCHRVHHA